MLRKKEGEKPRYNGTYEMREVEELYPWKWYYTTHFFTPCGFWPHTNKDAQSLLEIFRMDVLNPGSMDRI